MVVGWGETVLVRLKEDSGEVRLEQREYAGVAVFWTNA